MQIARLLFTLVGLGALTLGPSLAGEPAQAPAGPGPAENPAASARLAKKTQTKRPSATDSLQPGWNKPAAAKDGVMLNPIGTHRKQPARLPVGSGFPAPLPGVVRGRGAAAASIGGLAPSSAKTAAAVINGTGMRPNP